MSMAVRDVRALCIEEGHAPELMDFYLLAFAHDDLQETGDQHYWPGATLANIQSLMRRRSLGLIEQVDETPSERFPCPCCGSHTLYSRGGDDICPVCQWQDDGQDNDHADEVWGGPNGEISLTQARQNFRHFGISDLSRRK